jgi:hypothetical protein
MSSEPAAFQNHGVPNPSPLPSLQDVQDHVTALRMQVEQLFQQRDQLAQVNQKLTSELAAKDLAQKQLQAERDKYKELARVYIELANPLEEVLRDFENMPPVESLPKAEDVMANLAVQHPNVPEQKGA